VHLLLRGAMRPCYHPALPGPVALESRDSVEQARYSRPADQARLETKRSRAAIRPPMFPIYISMYRSTYIKLLFDLPEYMK